MKRFWAIFKKEFRQIRRDPLSLGLLIFVPAFLLMLYGYALSFDVKHVRVGVLDRGRVRVVLVVPRGYGRDLERGTPVRLQALVDGADATAATTVIG